MLAELTSLIPDRTLTPDEVRASATALLDAAVSSEAKAAFLRAWAERGETASELAACAEAFLPQAGDPGVRGSWKGKPLLDCCGTGGGGLNLINISTGLMFILAAMEIPVVKHGNRGLTKKSGSADVLEALDIRIDLPPGEVPRCLEEVGCAFLFAPAYHLSFAAVAPVRRQLAAEGRRTVFNLLGPLLNPARPDARLVGVFKPEHVTLYKEALERMGCARFAVVCGEDAPSGRTIGEVSARGVTTWAGTRDSDTRLERRSTDKAKLDTLLVTDPRESAARLVTLLGGEEQGLGRETLLINAAMASWTHGTASSLEEGLAQATEAVDSGKAAERLKHWQKYSRDAR